MDQGEREDQRLTEYPGHLIPMAYRNMGGGINMAGQTARKENGRNEAEQIGAEQNMRDQTKTRRGILHTPFLALSRLAPLVCRRFPHNSPLTPTLIFTPAAALT